MFLVPVTRRRRRVPSTMSTSPSSSTRASLVSSVNTHLATLPSQGGQLGTDNSDVYQQPIAGLTLLALCCPIGAAPRVNVDFSSRCSAPFLSVTHHHKTSRPPPARSCSWVYSTMSTSPCASSWVSEEPDATVLCTESSTIKSMSTL